MRTSLNEIKSRAQAFSHRWADACDEAAQAKPFWIDFFEIFGITDKRVATFEHYVRKLGGRPGFIDLFWPGKLLVEHKSLGKNLDTAIGQGIDYLPGLKESELPQLLVACDFRRFRVRIMATGQTVSFETRQLHKHVMLFGPLVGYTPQSLRPENPVNIKAAERMGRLHDAIKASGYGQSDGGRALELLLVRLLFCLFADDTGIFHPAQAFRDFVTERTNEDGSDLGPRLGQLFQVLNTPDGQGGPGNAANQRNAKLDEALASFPYINGGLFKDTLPLADFDAPMRELLIEACALDWSQISPAIFGSLFQSIMDAQARRNLGAHYTSEANILKLIGPLFLDQLHAEFERVHQNRAKLQEFHNKLQQLTFFDPACGCGNFLVISYRELRELELKVLRAAHALSPHKGQQALNVHDLVRVNVHQFYGIEIEEFPAQIAQVALWLADHQMNLRASEEFGQSYARIPLVNSPHIVCGNALTLDWNEVLPAQRCSYVLGNPPFIGAKYMSDEQREGTRDVFMDVGNAGLLDFVAAWFVKGTRYLHQAQLAGAHPKCAFVSTNSITQGEQVGVLWGWMLAQGVHIHFAHRTFQWRNEARNKAAVHCVIVGFGLQEVTTKTIYEYDTPRSEPHALPATNINPYLVDAPNVVLGRRSQPLCAVPTMVSGNKPIDGGHYLLTPEEKDTFLEKEPQAQPYLKRWLGGEEFLNGSERWCLCLSDASPTQLRAMPQALKRVEAVRNFRASSSSPPAQKLAAEPTRFHTTFQSESSYLAIPEVSSERRDYIPIAYLGQDVLCGNKLRLIANASLYHFGVMTSTMHMAWMRQVAGRLESRYQYSALIVYNNFPWPDATGQALSDQHRQAIEQAAQCVLDARAQFPEASLADLYDPLSMPPALLRAHLRLEAAVDKAYQPCGGKKEWKNDAERVAFLFGLYEQATRPLAQTEGRRRKRIPVNS